MHRLDRETSGALAVARTADAAAWLSACFRQHAEQAAASESGRSLSTAAMAGIRHLSGGLHRSSAVRATAAVQRPEQAAGGATVQRTYWAIVEISGVSIDVLPDSGRFDAPVWGGGNCAGGSDSGETGGGGGGWRPAATAFRVLRRGGGYAWLELRPETGRHAVALRQCQAFTMFAYRPIST